MTMKWQYSWLWTNSRYFMKFSMKYLCNRCVNLQWINYKWYIYDSEKTSIIKMYENVWNCMSSEHEIILFHFTMYYKKIWKQYEKVWKSIYVVVKFIVKMYENEKRTRMKLEIVWKCMKWNFHSTMKRFEIINSTKIEKDVLKKEYDFEL